MMRCGRSLGVEDRAVDRLLRSRRARWGAPIGIVWCGGSRRTILYIARSIALSNLRALLGEGVPVGWWLVGYIYEVVMVVGLYRRWGIVGHGIVFLQRTRKKLLSRVRAERVRADGLDVYTRHYE